LAGEDVHDLLAHAPEVAAELDQHQRANPLTLADETEQMCSVPM
jgi:hypothetical protein